MVIYLQAGKIFKIARKCSTDLPASRAINNSLSGLQKDIAEFSKKTANAASELKNKLIEYKGPYNMSATHTLAKRLGVDAEYAGPHIANFVTEALIDLRNAGVNTDGLVVRCKDLGNLPFHYDSYALDDKGILYFNSSLDWLKQSKRQKVKFYYRGSTSEHPLHQIYKGLIYALNKNNIPSSQSIRLEGQFRGARHLCNELYMDNCIDYLDFASEVGAGILGGQKYSDRVIDGFTKFNSLKMAPASKTIKSKYYDSNKSLMEKMMDAIDSGKRKLMKPNTRIPYKSLEYSGPYSIQECANIAKNLGFKKVEFADEHIANFFTEAMINLSKAGLDFKGVSVKSKELEDNILGRFVSKDNTVYFTTKVNWKKHINQAKSGYSSMFHSTASPLETCCHELIHAAHLNSLSNLEYNKFTKIYESEDVYHKLHAFMVSRYAVKDKDFSEFIAETGVGIICGIKYPPEVLKAYKAFKGPELKIISTGEDFGSKYQTHLDSIKNLPN